jgi:putative radical SAM enzyme (TIGR03279 family)
MAISTPAQNPRGDARRTRWTFTTPSYRPTYPKLPPNLVGLAAGSTTAGRLEHAGLAGRAPILGAAMALPRVVAVAPGSPADRAGLLPGDEIVTLGGQVPRDILEYQLFSDQENFELEVNRGGLQLPLEVKRNGGEPLGAEVDAALFDRVRTCDNHCEFCFIHQLPKGMRKSLYVRDDDYRLSFLYGNFTTLTRFTEADLERVVTEGLSPLFVSVHATDPEVRARMLRNRRAATSLRWLRALLDAGVEVHGQVVVCPGVNDGGVLEDTFAGILEQYPELASVACVPLGVSRFNREPGMRPHSADEASAVVDLVEEWQRIYESCLGRRLAYAADEYYLLASRPFPPLESYGAVAQHDNGVGMARAFEAAFFGREPGEGPQGRGPSGFFRSVDGAPALGYRAPRASGGGSLKNLTPARTERRLHGTTVLTGKYAERVLSPLISSLTSLREADIEVVAVPNEFFGGNIAVAGLLTGSDLSAALSELPQGRRYLLPDSCLSAGRFLDGLTPGDLPRPVEVVPADGASLRRALAPVVGDGHRARPTNAVGRT